MMTLDWLFEVLTPLWQALTALFQTCSTCSPQIPLPPPEMLWLF